MDEKILTVSQRQLMQSITMKVRVKRDPVFSLRWKIALWLIGLGARVSGMGLEVEDFADEQDNS
jgi:hypothetical protein